MFSQKDGSFERKIALFLEKFPSSTLAWFVCPRCVPEGLTWMLPAWEVPVAGSSDGVFVTRAPTRAALQESGDTHVTRVGREQIPEKMETSLPVSEITAQCKCSCSCLPCGKHRGVTSHPQQQKGGSGPEILNFKLF